ncbi:GntR family transcriptional regulator [Pseudoduganella namucuonensis]|uniref:Transcriptional regulator, GntR family n=1 Tax=Pseudoduganella namucuonensis TaxID=1035707 RepID=A0A1I7JZC0_9BURK|nr:GntR family transcriptional regulator [Pseudoduganella namucuonensis]SFU90568.1 transcriptional regulator, GntR family [Pseudoduganella namucuonensis]
MSRTPIVFKKTSNLLLEFIGDELTVGEALPSEQRLATICQASRTVVRNAIGHLQTLRVIDGATGRRVIRPPADEDYFHVEELRSGSERVQQVLMDRVLQRDLQPGAEFSEAELAREADTSTASVREFLTGFARCGLIQKKPRGGWRLRGFDRSFASELADMRQRFEFEAVERFCALQPDDPAHTELAKLIARHEQLKPRMISCYSEFPALDRQFHTFLVGLLGNRFAQGFYDIISFVFHYHYQWEKSGERERTVYALEEHLAVLYALSERDQVKAVRALRKHLDTARETLGAAIGARVKSTDGSPLTGMKKQ